jgi:hypothetical protein
VDAMAPAMPMICQAFIVPNLRQVPQGEGYTHVRRDPR